MPQGYNYVGMTFKQHIAAKELVENGGNVPRALRKAGYSAAMIKNPQKVTRSRGFQEVLGEIISDEKLALVLREGLDAVKPVKGKGSDGKFLGFYSDFAVRRQYVEICLRLKGYLSIAQQSNDYNHMRSLSDEELDAIIVRGKQARSR